MPCPHAIDDVLNIAQAAMQIIPFNSMSMPFWILWLVKVHHQSHAHTYIYNVCIIIKDKEDERREYIAAIKQIAYDLAKRPIQKIIIFWQHSVAHFHWFIFISTHLTIMMSELISFVACISPSGLFYFKSVCVCNVLAE